MKCQSSGKENNKLLKVKESTDKGKYNLLRGYYPKWNQITKVSRRVLIDTYAGSGMVCLMGGKNLMKKRVSKKIYGSPLLAILKTLTISNKLTIILNEADPEIFFELNKYVQDFVENGVPVFVSNQTDYEYKSLQTQRKRKQRIKGEWIFPESPEDKPKRGYISKRIHSKAEIKLYNRNIEEIIDEIITKYLSSVKEEDKIIKPIALFFVDPCGVVEWNTVIKKICERSNKEEGTDLIINWSYEAIARTLNTTSKNITLSRIYGIPLENIDKEFRGITEMDQFLDKYIAQLKNYFIYVINYGIPRDRKIKPRQSKYRKYFLLVCTNNPSGASLAGYKAGKIKRALRGYKDMISYF